MKTFAHRKLATIFSIFAFTAAAFGGSREITSGDWMITVNDATGAVDLTLRGEPLLKGSVAEWSVGGDTLSLGDCGGVKVKRTDTSDRFGRATLVTLTGKKGDLGVEQKIWLHPDAEFATTELTVSDRNGTSSNYLAPVAVSGSYELFSRPGNRVIFVPYDNDAWVRYSNTPFGEQAPVSYEVSALVNADTREGLVVGSVEHDVWKTGVKTATTATTAVDTLKVYGGVATNLTRDVIPHGKVNGKSVKSPLVFVGRYADWRDGMEAFADACATVAPKIASLGGRPFGWNSWGKLQTKISYDKAMEVSDFIHDKLQNETFNNDGVVYIGLDAFWDFGFKEEQHKQFTEHCRANGQKAGIYYCPFTDWWKSPDSPVAEAPEYKWKDLYLYGNGEPLTFDGAYAIDPTHPAVRERIRRQLQQFIDWGYEYVKIDFMAHGAYEADSHYDHEVTTGVQAFNSGMQFINDCAQGKLWINLSIAPLFPANYAHSRRIGCDAWADINNTEYTLNALTYGWWLDHVYHFNDADHIVLEGVSAGENRARITSSAITGVYLLGDDMSQEGDDAVKNRIRRSITNGAINAMAAECGSFRPVELGKGDRAAESFMHDGDDHLYVALFNFSDKAATKTLPLHRLGLSESRDYKAMELWSADATNLKGEIAVEIPAKDVKVFRIEK